MFAPEAPLVIHDGELADLCQLLTSLGLGFSETTSRDADVAAYYEAPLVIACAPFLLERLTDSQDKHPKRVVFLKSEARTVSSILARSGVDWIVRRPVHPTALRLFILHCLYRGRDKRDNQRVCIGREVQVRGGWRRRKALLAEMSSRDCRLVTRHRFKLDQKVQLKLPRAVTSGRALSLRGQVVRIGEANPRSGVRDVCLLFDPLEGRDAELITRMIESHARGPAIFDGDLTGLTGLTADDHSGIATESPPERPEHPQDPRLPNSLACRQLGDADANRRGASRHTFERRVIALGDEAARVLLGRDISRSGMRVDASSSLELGDELKLAIHAPGSKTPLVLRAMVMRDDGEHGQILQFALLSPEAESYLEAMIQPLPELAASGELAVPKPQPESQLVVSEILEHASALD